MSTLVVVVTGMSGAGKTTAVATLEDLGFYCVDNLPPEVMEQTLLACEGAGVFRVALGIDVRLGGFLDRAAESLSALAGSDRQVTVVFLDASDEALLRRFSSTRRPHPLSTAPELGSERAPTAVLDGVRVERELLASLRERAHVVLDTTGINVHELRRRIVAHFGAQGTSPIKLRTRLVSFGFTHGLPIDADTLLDVRFLDNPYFVPELSQLSGVDAPVKDFVLANPEAQEYLRRAVDLLQYCLPLAEREGRSYVTIAVGCTGGRHRSVAISEELAKRLRQGEGREVEVLHRDLARFRQESHGTLGLSERQE